MDQLALNLQSPPEYCTIPLTKQQVAIIDLDNYDLLSQWSWSAMWSKKTQSFYAVRSETINGERRFLLMHRVILDAPADLEVDHKSHDTLDNRRQNLRLATHAQNAWNQKQRRSNATGFTGVVFNKTSGNFIAKIHVNGKKINLGAFPSAELAGAAYEAAAIALHGEFHTPMPNVIPAETFRIKSKRDMKSNNRTGFVGVTLDKRRGKYVATATISGNARALGYFDTAEQASARRTEVEVSVAAETYKLRARRDPSARNKSGRLGVCFDKRKQLFRSYVTIDGKQTGLGYFATAEDASIFRQYALGEIQSGRSIPKHYLDPSRRRR